jgi:ABC-type lipoprotein export system ATPase subunit
MLKLKTLKFKNVGRFTEEQFIDFTAFSNLIQVDAINQNTGGGSSGSGKSTVFNILLWVMGLDTLPTTTLQSRLTTEHISGTVELDWDGKNVTIKRGRKLSVTIEGQTEVTGSSKLAEEELDKIYGINRSLFTRLLVKAQGDQGFFLNMGPSKIFEFLTDCLNLAPIRSKIDVIDLKLKELAQAKDKAQSDLQASQAALDAIKSAQSSLGTEPTTTVTDALVEGYKAKLNELESTLEALKGHHKLERENFQAKRPALDAIPYDRTQIEALESEIKSLEVQINAELEKERARQVKVNADISAIKLEANSKISVLKLEHGNKIGDAKTTMFNLSNMVNTGKSSKETAIQLAAEIKIIRDGRCHTCEQPWANEKSKAEEQVLLKKLDECKTDIEASVVASKEIEELKKALIVLNDKANADVAALTTKMNEDTAALSEEVKPQQSPEFLAMKEKALALSKQKTAEFIKEDDYKTSQNARNQKLQDTFHAEHGALIQKHQAIWESVSKEVNEAKSRYEQNAQALATHLIALKRYQDSLDSLKKKESEASLKVAENIQKVVDLADRLEIAEEAKRCLKSYLSCSFDDALDSISETATRLLRSAPTMANATIRLQGTREASNGSIKEQVTAVVDDSGELDIPIKSLSGGERSSLDLAIDLAVCELIQERANKGIDIMVLDEPFNAMDTINIENSLEMLKAFAVNKRLLFVEHDSIAKEMVNDRITVIRTGETSHIQ